MSVRESAVDSMFGAGFGFRRALGVLAGSEVHAGSGVAVRTGGGVGVGGSLLPQPTVSNRSIAEKRVSFMNFLCIAFPLEGKLSRKVFLVYSSTLMSCRTCRKRLS